MRSACFVRVRVRVRGRVVRVFLFTSLDLCTAFNFIISSLCLPARSACEGRVRVMVMVRVRVRVRVK